MAKAIYNWWWKERLLQNEWKIFGANANRIDKMSAAEMKFSSPKNTKTIIIFAHANLNLMRKFEIQCGSLKNGYVHFRMA